MSIYEQLKQTADKFPDKTAFSDGTDSLSFAELLAASQNVAAAVAVRAKQEPVVVCMDKHPNAVAAYIGVLAAGAIYVPLDRELGQARVAAILGKLAPRLVVADETSAAFIAEMELENPPETLLYSEIPASSYFAPPPELPDNQPAYIMYTSGSTGTPKGVAVSHRALIDYIYSLSEVLGVTEETVFGNQTPLYMDASLKDIYPTIFFGATTYLIPHGLFTTPLRVVEYLNRYSINTIFWVVSALTLVSGFGTLKKLIPESLTTIAFGGEVFPVAQFHLWREALPNARFLNLYGPTEITGVCAWYEVEGEITDGIPIGKPFANTEILLHNGEILVRGPRVALGYWGEPDKTAEVFVQNPNHNLYRDIVYRTGDLARYNENGDLVFVSRADHQIKHLGYRVELGEIEATAGKIEGLASVCCVFDKETGRITMFYAGDIETKELSAALRKLLPRYLQPDRVKKIDEMPKTGIGKIDRVSLLALAKGN
ncbi:MAG: amino acid adenylation domain-containing protein [Oscillospiraceae bacterium]|nr:amino acid adenylation domain-containing protein [Oscillospiraceae bacterium]